MSLLVRKFGKRFCSKIDRSLLSRRYRGGPEICLFIVKDVPEKLNFLGTPYENGYPDFKPAKLIIHNRELGHPKHLLEIILSLKITGRHLYRHIIKNFSREIKVLFFKDNGGAHTHHYEPQNKIRYDDDRTLYEIGIREMFEIMSSISIDYDNPYSEMDHFMSPGEIRNKAIKPEVKTRKDLILMEELFENINEGKFYHVGSDLDRCTSTTRKKGCR